MSLHAITEYLKDATSGHVSDIFIIAGRAITFKKDGQFSTIGERLTPEDAKELIREIYTLAQDRSMEPLLNTGDDDFSFSIPGLSRFRVNAYRQRGSYAAAIRVIAFELPNSEDLHIPDDVMELADISKGMVLITGSAGSGKSTTMACLIDRINHTREGHIITIEDPLEYLHRHDRCIVSQRELDSDTDSFLVALRAALRQSPDVILLGEMRDYETIQTALTAAETGHLLLSSLHTTGAANSIERILDVFEPNQQRQIALQLSMTLQAVVSQQLVPDVDGHNIPVFEVMKLTPAIRNMIRENKVYQIDGIISSSTQQQMRSMDQSLFDLYRQKIITKDTALKYASNVENLRRKLL
jgi:twitching motility protein PilT